MSSEPRKTCSRRGFVAGTAAGMLAGAAVGWKAKESWPPHWWPYGNGPLGQLAAQAGQLGIPGPYPGRVVEVHHPGSVQQGQRDANAVRMMLDRGMRELVGSDESVEAWRRFFLPGDRVGIKVVPVGKPLSISSFELVREVASSLRSAGVRTRDILVFERYKNEFLAAGYEAQLPDGVHWECSSASYDEFQTEIDGQLPRQRWRESRIAGYDRDHYCELPYAQVGSDETDDRRFRSHVSKIITQKVDKFISIPVLKDHRSAGVTLSLKNLSHGSVNNVARSHIVHAQQTHAGKSINQCGTFIPSVVSLPVIREKAVLQILDGLIGTYEGGPGNWNSTFATWEYKSLLFATDPVALDHVGWGIIDAKRKAEGMPPVGSMGLDAHANLHDPPGVGRPTEQFHIRQPEHISIAGSGGLGVFDLAGIDHRKLNLGS